jgi:hypothetical protein
MKDICNLVRLISTENHICQSIFWLSNFYIHDRMFVSRWQAISLSFTSLYHSWAKVSQSVINVLSIIHNTSLLKIRNLCAKTWMSLTKFLYHFIQCLHLNNILPIWHLLMSDLYFSFVDFQTRIAFPYNWFVAFSVSFI